MANKWKADWLFPHLPELPGTDPQSILEDLVEKFHIVIAHLWGDLADPQVGIFQQSAALLHPDPLQIPGKGHADLLGKFLGQAGKGVVILLRQFSQMDVLGVMGPDVAHDLFHWFAEDLAVVITADFSHGQDQKLHQQAAAVGDVARGLAVVFGDQAFYDAADAAVAVVEGFAGGRGAQCFVAKTEQIGVHHILKPAAAAEGALQKFGVEQQVDHFQRFLSHLAVGVLCAVIH